MSAFHTLVVRITPEQYDKLAALARAKDRSMASLVRTLIDRAAAQEQPPGGRHTP